MEGLALGRLQLALASILILLNRTSFTERELRAPGSAPRSLRSRLVGVARWLIGCLYSPLIWGTLFFLTWKLIINIYTRKNGGYRQGFVWQHFQPHHLKPIDAFIAKYVTQYLPKMLAQYVPKLF